MPQRVARSNGPAAAPLTAVPFATCGRNGLTAGFAGAGMDVVLVGPLPTPAIAMLTRSLRADLGVMVSASHNPYEDNGIKLFGPDGLKLSDAEELEIETLMAGDLTRALVPPARLGRASRLDDAPGRYIEAAKQSFPRGLTLEERVRLDIAYVRNRAVACARYAVRR